MRLDNKDISIYIHIPFCSKKCPYCHFYVIADNEHLKDVLLQALLLELQRYTDVLSQRTIVSIYFGGGTPALFGAARIAIILDQLRKFSSSTCEITLEANPEEITQAQILDFARIGINRMSYGVQSLSDTELQLLGRKHSSAQAQQVLFYTHHAGIENISIDLMYETPTQTLESWQKSLYTAVSLPICHISLYNLTFEPGTPYKRKEAQLRSLIVDETTATNMYLQAIQLLEEHNFSQYEVSAFCVGNHMSLHNMGYWTGREFIGLGPSAFSFLENKRFSNIANLVRYASLLESGNSPVDFVDATSLEDRKKELLALHLRMRQGVFLPRFQEKFGQLSQETHTSLQQLISQGLAINHQENIQLTMRGLLFYDTVASEII